jgi:serine/threonine protein kinase/Tfp pilus assembly protein PilF
MQLGWSRAAEPSAAADVLAAVAAAPHARRAEHAGDVIDRYRLVRLLGEGGFGTVFLAQQTEPVVRDVALKVIRRGMDTDQVIARFELERQALAMMDHPGIARVLDAGATASGRPYFVMEYVDGLPITRYCDEHKLSIRQRLELIEQACLAVQHAHQKGIIHRDLKPGNILVTRVDDRAIPKIIDFGVAKATDAAAGSTGAEAMTLEAQVIGTPQYMSPEQATSGAAKIDTRTDVYSLGTVLYELLTGAAPFDPESLRRAGFSGFVRILRDETPAKPSTRVSQSRRTDMPATTVSSAPLRRQLAGEIDWIVMKALEKDPARRYQSAAELAADIRRHLSDQAVLAGPPSRFYPLRKFARRHRIPIAAAAAVVLTLIAATITSTLLAARARRAEADARQQAARAEEELARSNAIVSFTSDLLGGIAPGVARGRDTALLRDLLDDSIRKADANLASQPTIDLAVRRTIGEALNDLGDQPAALAQLRKIYDATAGPKTKDHPERLRIAVAMAQILIDQFELQEAESLAKEALAGYRRIGRDDSDDAYLARIAEAGVYMHTNRSDEAERRFAQILKHFRDAGHGESTAAVIAWTNLAQAMADQDRWPEATEQWLALNALQRRIYGENHPYAMMTLNDIGSGMVHQQRFDEGETYFRRALAVARKIFDPSHPTLLTNMNNLASMLIDRGKLDDADALLTEALENGRKKLGPMDTPMDVLVLHMGRLRTKQGRFDEAVKYAYELHDAVAAKYGERDVKTISSLVQLYDALFFAKRGAEGVAIVEKIGEFPPGVDPFLRQRLHAAAGMLYLQAGDESGARRCAALARAAVQMDQSGTPRVTGSLRELEKRLHITPATNVTPPAISR